MNEIFPVLAGVALGLGTYAVRSNWFKAVLVTILGLALGTIASWISGELTLNWVYVVVDTAQVVGAAIMSGLLVRVSLRRRRRSLAR